MLIRFAQGHGHDARPLPAQKKIHLACRAVRVVLRSPARGREKEVHPVSGMNQLSFDFQIEVIPRTAEHDQVGSLAAADIDVR
jgi:hypothetical protein